MQSVFLRRWPALKNALSHHKPLRAYAQRLGLTSHRNKPGDTHQGKRDAVFHPEFIEDLRYWVETNRKTALRAFDLIEAILRDPFNGIGKPEPLRYMPTGTWSRRLTQEHRIVYLISKDRVDFLQCRYHY